jgi:hypothetical protein
MSIKSELDGQTFEYNQISNRISTTIETTYKMAYRDLKWKIKSEGIGINRKIMVIVLEKKTDLHVRVGEKGRSFLLPFNEFYEFWKHNNTDDVVRGIALKVLPLALFHDYEIR